MSEDNVPDGIPNGSKQLVDGLGFRERLALKHRSKFIHFLVKISMKIALEKMMMLMWWMNCKSGQEHHNQYEK